MKVINLFFAGLSLLGIAGCAGQSLQREAAAPVPRPLGGKISLFRAASTPNEPSSQTALAEPAGTVTLNMALSLALMQNPELTAFSWEVRALEARRLQSALLPNPELEFTAENLGGTGSFQGTRGMESTIQLSQLVELGGKRIKRARIAELEKNLAGWDYETKRLDVLTEVTIAFINVLASQERLALTGEIVGLAEQVYYTVSERVKAGKVSPVEEIKAGVALSTSKIDLDRTRNELEVAKNILSATWGSTKAVFEKVDGNFDAVVPIPSIENLADIVNRNPDIARWAMEIGKRTAEIERARAGRVPDLKVSGGFRRTNESGDNSFVVGISLPLQIFNRNQGEIREAGYRLVKANEERRAAEVRIRTRMMEAYQALFSAYLETNAWKTKVLPGAQRAFEAVREGYQYGKFGLLDVLDAQRTLFNAKSRYIETLAEYHIGVANVERLTGTPLGETQNFGDSNEK